MTKRWAGLPFVLLLTLWTRLAGATITMNPTIVDVGNTVVAATGTNTGSLSSDVNGEAVDLVLTTTCSGTGTGTFSFTGSVTNLNLNAAKTITVNYVPATRGQRTCDVQVVDTGTSNVRITFQVRGTGIAPIVSAPASLTATNVRMNDASTVAHTSTVNLVVTNSSTDAGQTLTVSSVTSNNADYTITPPGNTTINPNNGTATWVVTFDPSVVGADNATLTINSNDPITPAKTVPISGSGLGAVINVTDIAFGNVPWGSTTTTATTTISNAQATNTGTLTVASASITGSSWVTFATGTGCTAGTTACTLTGITAPGNKTVLVRCIPPTNAVGTQNATLTFVSDTDPTGADSSVAISCTSQPHPNISVDVSSIAFGNQLVTTTSGSQAATVTNNGNSDLMFYFTETGTDTAMFGEMATGSCGTTMMNQCVVTPGSNIPINVTFSPTSRGAKSATLNINSNDPDTGDNVKLVTLGGTGVAPQIGVNPASFDYMGIRDSDSATTPFRDQTFTISNASNDAGQVLTISSITFSGTNMTDFFVQTAGGTSINPSANTPYVVRFNPSGTGLRTATMTIATNDPLTPNRTVMLQGTGTSGVIAVSDVNFNTISAGTVATQNITVSNAAAANVGVLTATMAVISSTSTWFSFGTGSGCTAGTASCVLSGVTMPGDKSVPIRCNPPSNGSGTATATVTFSSDSDGGGDNVASISCTAGRPNIMVSATMLDFSSVIVGQTGTAQTFMIMNNGNTDLTFWLSETGTDVSMFAETVVGQATCGFAAGTPCTVTMGSSMTVSVTFSPTSMGAKTATLNINNNDPDAGDNLKTVTLAGNGIAPVATPDMPSISFGNVEVTKTSGNTRLTITNTGTSTLTISNAGLVSGGMLVGMTTEYSVVAGTGPQTTMVTMGSTAFWDINCHPTSQGNKPATFRVLSNGFGSATVDVPLSCNGQQGILTVTGGTAPANFYDFGPVPQMPQTVPYRDFTVTNTGNVPVTNIMVNYNATQLAGFSIVSGMPTFPIASLASGANFTVRVQFNPQTGTDGCVIGSGVTCAFTLTGGWGVTPINTSATIVTVGDGLVQGYDTTPSYPNPVDFGDVRFDQTKDMTFQIINTAGSGGASVGIGTLSITPGTAMSGEFTIISCTRGGAPLGGAGTGGCPTTAVPFNLPPVSNPIVVTVRVDPNNRVAMMDATLTVTSNLGGATPNRTVPLKANSITAGLGVTPATNVLDFGPTDLDAVPVSVTKRITLTNTGTASLNVGNGVIGGDMVHYVFTSVTNRVVPSGMTFDIDVTYTPTVEKPANNPDTATLMFPITGVFAGPSSVTIQITGYGADRHIVVGNAPMFPDTFTNPGPLAPVLPVSITNNGDVKLNISAVMLDNDPIWTIQNPDPVSIDGRGTYDFNIAFAPVEVGKAPTGHFVIMNNDNGMMIVSVDLNGNGIDRKLSFGPPVDFGYVGIGLKAHLSDISPKQLLDVSNDGEIEITITGIDTSDDAFAITDLDGKPVGMMTLLPHTVEHFDVTFKPDRVGDYSATGILNIEGGATQTVQINGRGLYADAKGGGGCSTSNGGSRGWLVLVLGALFAAGRRRRRRQAAVAALVVAAATPAAADERDIDLDVFDPTPATVGRTFHVQHADIGVDGSWSALALMTYANNALIIDTSQNDDTPVKNRALLTLGGAYVFGGRFEAGAHVPIVLQSGDEFGDPLMDYTIAPAKGAQLADASLHLKARLGEAPALGGKLVYGAGLTLTLPTATGEFGGNDKPTGRVQLLGSLMPSDRLSISLNAGGILRGTHRYASLNQGSGVSVGAGATYWIIQQLWATAEIFGELTPGGHFDEMGNKEMLMTIEGLAGVHFLPARAMSLGVAFGRGVTSGPGAPAFRGILTFTYTPGAAEMRVLHPPTKPKPPADDDTDGVPNTKDECPVDKEDHDNFQDEDGCPETDNDRDGVPDATDNCPLNAEDRDHIEDEDGCPDGDNDNDGVLDNADKCPTAAEDKDGFQDNDGCPEIDNDKDGLLDTVDKCPIEAEVINGVTDDDGCPDKGDALVVLSPDRLELLENVQFSKGAKIDVKASANVLGQIGATLRAHPEIVRVRLTVHVQPSKDPAADLKLSEARAKAIREWLADWGIDPLRLQSSGFGSKQPLVPPTTKGAQMINDRLELIVLERK